MGDQATYRRIMSIYQPIIYRKIVYEEGIKNF